MRKIQIIDQSSHNLSKNVRKYLVNFRTEVRNILKYNVQRNAGLQSKSRPVMSTGDVDQILADFDNLILTGKQKEQQNMLELQYDIVRPELQQRYGDLTKTIARQHEKFRPRIEKMRSDYIQSFTKNPNKSIRAEPEYNRAILRAACKQFENQLINKYASSEQCIPRTLNSVHNKM